MMQGPFLLCLCQRGAFTGSHTISFFAVPLCRKRKAVSDRPIHEWNKPSCTAGKPGRMILSVRPDTFGRTYKIILHCRWFARFHASGNVPFPFGVFPFSRISLLKFSCPICLHFRLPPFSRLSGSTSGSHFRSGRKGNSGIGRECKVKPPVFGKNLQPCG